MRYLIIVLLLFGSGCSSLGTIAPSPNANLPHNPQVPLFPEDNELISDTEIGRILDTKIQVPAKFRIVLVHLVHERQQDGRLLGNMDQNQWPVVNNAFTELQNSGRIYDVSYLPQMLLPIELSAGKLRSAAARYQADWVLIFRTSTRLFTKNPLFSASRARTFCQADVMVLDVRTGLIAFSSRSRVSLTKEEEDQEWSLAETACRAEQEAIEEAMGLNVEKLVSYITQFQE